MANYCFQTKLIHLFIHSLSYSFLYSFYIQTVILMACMTLRYYSAQHKEGKMARCEVLWDNCRLQEEGKRKNWNQNAVLTRSPSLMRLIMTPTLTLSLVKTSLKDAFHCSVCLHTKPKWQTCPLSSFLPSLCSTYRPQVAGGTPIRRGSTGKGVFFRYMKW